MCIRDSSWGVVPVLLEEKTSTDDLFEHVVSVAEERGLVKAGDIAVITAGIPLGISGTTNTVSYTHLVPKMWHADFTLACHGDSMEPRVKDGDVVAVRRTPVVENGEIAAVRIDDEATLKPVSYTHLLIL